MKSKIINGCKYWGQLFLLPVYWLSFLFPRDQKLWLFGSTFGRRFADNPRYLYLYVSQHSDRASDRVKQQMAKWQAAGHAYAEDENCKDIRAVWITHKKEIAAFLTEEGYEAYYYHSLKGIYLALRAGIYIYDNYSKDINFWQSGGAVKFNLWHGSGNKKTNYDNKFDFVRHPRNNWERFRYFLRRLSDEKPYHYTLATGPMMADIFTSAFRTDLSHIVQAGYPRNDALFSDCEISNVLTKEEKKVVSDMKWQKQAGYHLLVYMPTFRDSEELFFDVMNLAQFDAYLKKQGYVFYTKLHPKSKLCKKFEQIKAERIINISAEADPYTFLSLCDNLVTDYSSIYSDYLMLNRPSVLFPFDFSEYTKDTRECYFTYEEYMPEIRAVTMQELMDDIVQVNEEDHCEEGRLALRDRIFKTSDSTACRTIVEVVRTKLLKG